MATKARKAAGACECGHEREEHGGGNMFRYGRCLSVIRFGQVGDYITPTVCPCQQYRARKESA
jgi:hypothetical protein